MFLSYLITILIPILGSDHHCQLIFIQFFSFQTGQIISYKTPNSSEFEGEIVLISHSRFCYVVTNFSEEQTEQLIDKAFTVHTKDLARVTVNGDVVLVRVNTSNSFYTTRAWTDYQKYLKKFPLPPVV